RWRWSTPCRLPELAPQKTRRRTMLDEQILLASEIAANAHTGQYDKGGHAYIAHPMRVAFRVPDICKPVALLHDVLEDTPTSTNALRSLGIHDDIVADVVMLTKPSGMTNKEYRQRVVME